MRAAPTGHPVIAARAANPCVRSAMRTVSLGLLVVALAACSSRSAPGSRPDGPVSRDALARICAVDDIDETSKIYVAKDAAGQVHRVVVTPTRDIADMGNLIFDPAGEYLGHDTGGEFPWDDEVLVANERARVAKLMDGATVDRSSNQTCPAR